MFILYIKERKAWLIFFITLQIWLNFILTLDVAFGGISLLYINFINITAFVVFFMWRYYQETKYIKALENSLSNEKSLDFILESFPGGYSSFEKMLSTTIDDLILVAKEELNGLKVEHLEENDLTLSWIHEVKTPLTSMKLMIDSLDDRSAQKKLEVEWLRIHLLLDQQLHNTRLSTIEKDYIIEGVDIQKILHMEIKEFQAWCIQKNIGFDLGNLEVKVMSDQKWLAFIVRQILSNAIKYSYADSEIHIRTYIDDTDHVILMIRDSGIGISRAELPRIFEKAFTGKVGRQTTASTGMGLYLAKNVAEQLGIHISVSSTIGEGSTLSLQFPLKNEIVKILGR
ncbi:two-component system, OmpR family, bacitracin resistance sensor histidine kinase BceS [Psychrobacillus sp. OK028]|uniref:sensor histidine kinase n=1 Tax=Psychrobacillus sp. OK028 TaxID=1884359 RepID=UPI00088EFFCC|nr:sensor histidine kinase [Psychrobacillus sp. OK028]SDN92747.1 two-component system, OmpR family, bacitracin resistance sensor histidine kinase BceS [Psychrobacillus sp. OK028]